MPNGRRGDHPLTDILHFGESEFGEPVDSTVKALSRHPAFGSVRDRVADLLAELSPMGKPPERAPELRREAASKLEQIKREL